MTVFPPSARWRTTGPAEPATRTRTRSSADERDRTRRAGGADERPVRRLGGAVPARVLAAVPALPLPCSQTVRGVRVRPVDGHGHGVRAGARGERVAGTVQAVRRPLAAQDPESVAAAPFTVTVKLAGRRCSPSSRRAPVDVDVAPKRQLVAATGSVPKYASRLPQPPVRWTSPMRTWLSALPSFQTRICESREKQSAYCAASSCAQRLVRGRSRRVLAIRTSTPTGRYACPQPP